MFFVDLMGDAGADSEHLVVGRLTAGAADLQDMIQHELGLQVVQHKSTLVASNDKLLRRLRISFGKFSWA